MQAQSTERVCERSAHMGQKAMGLTGWDSSLFCSPLIVMLWSLCGLYLGPPGNIKQIVEGVGYFDCSFLN